MLLRLAQLNYELETRAWKQTSISLFHEVCDVVLWPLNLRSSLVRLDDRGVVLANFLLEV